jgi:4-amino-4-deoxy-L-arabinose transferase-like glycosyltransferase
MSTELIKNGSALLPFLAFSGCWIALWRRGQDWRTSLLVSATLWGVWVAATTELLSLGSLFTRGAVAAVWLVASIVAWCFALFGAKGHQVPPASDSKNPAAAGSKPLSTSDWLLLAGLLAVMSLLAVIAFAAPPDTWDAMQYNMPRMVMWIENRSVHFYPTLDYQQLMMSPWSEYAMTHLTLLQGSDRLVNLVEWFSFLGSIIGVSLIARELGAGPRGQVLAAILCGTIPHAILAATSAKPDVAVSFWIVASCFFLLRWKSAATWNNTLLAGATIGLATLTKGTAFILLPAIVLAAFCIWPATNRSRFLVRLPAFLLVILALNGPQFYRNFRLAGSPLGFASPDGDADKKGDRHFANGKFGVRDIAGNVLRSAALHFETPNNKINAWTTARFRQLIRAVGIDPDDPAMIEQGNSGENFTFYVPRASRTEVLAGNMFHAILFLLSAAILVVLWRSDQRDTALLAIGVIAAFVLFCAAVRWQPYNGRFHLPAFMLGCAIIGSVLASRLPRWTFLTGALAILAAMPYVLSNEIRPLLGIRYFHGLGADHTPNIFSASRDRLYFGDQHLYLADSYLAAAHAVAASGCEHVALDAFVLHYEYPMLAILRAGMGGSVVQYVGVRNRSAIYEHPAEPIPCAVVCLGCALVHQKRIEYAGPGTLTLQFDSTLVFLRQPVEVSAPTVTDTTKTSALKTAEATSALSTPADSDSPAVGLDPCDILPEGAVREVLGPSVTHSREKIICRYDGAVGQMEIAAFPPTSYYSSDYETLASESMGSLQFREPGHSITIVLDRDNPVLAYLHKDNATYSLNIYRENPRPTSEDYVRLAEMLNARLPSSSYTPN